MTLEEYIIALAEADVENKEQWSSLLSVGMELMNISDREMAREVEWMASGIVRWKTGVSLPYPGVRTMVLRKLAKRANELLEASKDVLGNE